MTEEQIREFVGELVRGEIFSSFHMSARGMPPAMVNQIFLPFALAGPGDFDIATVGLIYERIRRAAPIAIDGYPVFMSVQFMHIDDWTIVEDRWKKALAALDAATKGDES